LPERTIPPRAVVSWVLYDLANTIFSMGVVSLYFSLYVRDAVGPDRADAVYSVATAVSMALIFVVSPLLGAMTDRARRRMPFLIWSTIVCCACTALLARGPFALSIVLFVVANAVYQAGVQFYDALLPEVTTEANRGRVSGLGVGIGYVGSYIAVGLGFLIEDRATLFTLIAIAFLVFALPCFLFVRERGNPLPRPVLAWSAIRSSLADTLDALRSTRRFPGLARFLVGRVFYTDAINTVIAFMALYAVSVATTAGRSSEAAEDLVRLVMMAAITCAIAGGIVWGRIVDRQGPKRTLTRVLQLWMITFVLAAAIGLFALPVPFLYAVAVLVGIALGGIWAADRPYMLRLTPPDRVGEFYGLYGMVGRFSAIVGPLIWGAITWLAVERSGLAILTGQALAIVALLAMVVLSAWILRRVDDAPRTWEAETEVTIPQTHVAPSR
jgi:UMF1 family MFS transporter